MEYALEIYKVQTVSCELVTYRLTADNTMIMEFKEKPALEYNDLIWTEEDISKNDSTQMLVVIQPLEGNEVLLKRPSDESVYALRHFKKEEVFKLVASFRPKEDGSDTQE